MPLRLRLPSRGWSAFELPVLPFLCPRLSQPWPSGVKLGKRGHSSAAIQHHDNTLRETSSDHLVGSPVQNLLPRVHPADGHIDLPTESKKQIPGDGALFTINNNSSKRSLQSRKLNGHTQSRERTTNPEDGNVSSDYGRSSSTSPRKKKVHPHRRGYNDSRRKIQDWKHGFGTYRMKPDTQLDPGLRRRILARQRLTDDHAKLEKIPNDPHQALRYFGHIFNKHVQQSLASPEKLHQLRDPHDTHAIPKQTQEALTIHRVLAILRDEWSGSKDKERPLENEIDKRMIKLLVSETDAKAVHNTWLKLPVERQAVLWPLLICSTLLSCPQKTLKVLSGTYTAPYPSHRVVGNVLSYIIWHFLDGRKDPDPILGDILHKSIVKMLMLGPPDYVYLPQDSLWLLLKHCQRPDLLYRSLTEINNPMSADTLMHFASRIAKSGPLYQDDAFEILRRIGDLGADFKTPQMESVCATILMNSHKNSSRDFSEKFAYMLQCGLQPNIIHYNVLLLKTLRSGDYERGWEIFNMMKKDGPDPDVYTHSIVLHDAKSRLDQAAIQSVMRSVRENNIKTSYIVTDALHSLLLLDQHAKHREEVQSNREGWVLGTNGTFSSGRTGVNRKVTFQKMLPLYCEHFHLEPLFHLLPGFKQRLQRFQQSQTPTLSPIDSQFDVLNQKVLVDPTPEVLVIMITALLKNYPDPDTPKWFYERLSNLMQVGDPMLKMIAEKRENAIDLRHIYNLIILALGRYVTNIPAILKIIGQMTTSGKKGDVSAAQNANQNQPIRIPKPDAYTWNILIKVFLRHGQTRAAEKVLSMMRDRGLEPSMVSWNTLLFGYARMQNIPMVTNTIARQQAGGYNPDEITIGALKKVVDHRSLREALAQQEIQDMEERASSLRDTIGTVEDSEVQQSEEEFVIGDLEAVSENDFKYV
ncbi:hypothetical protein BGZ60DRAFT_395726 [Tricladium varicosporioides]|nr:hypothetical protein BGZ60DRAFT_395726 [Hymenoscyphus varicosporioides]